MNASQFIKETFKDDFLEFNKYLDVALSNSNPRINEIIKHVFKSSGKRVRPIMVFLAAKACGNITPETYHGAVTVELLHTATLIHDDVVDESDIRRSQPSANAIFDNKRSVLAGDYLLSSSLVESVKTNSLDVVRIISDLGKKLSEGELNQYSLVNEIIIDENEYFEVINKKTASLMDACMRIGAITAGAEKEIVEDFGEVGRLMGIAFQLRDDIFDYYNQDVGKPTGNDIREGKITLPLLYALKNSKDKELFLDIIRNKEFDDKNIERLIEFAIENKGIEHTYNVMNEHLEKADVIIKQMNINEEVQSLIQTFIIFLRNRDI